MTFTGKVFKAYASAITEKHGFGSSKMVEQGSPNYINAVIMRGQRLIDKARWAEEKTSILLSEYDAAIAGKAEGLQLWEDLAAAEKWLVNNGWLRSYDAVVSRSRGHKHWEVTVTYYGLTGKGWSVAKKYLDD